MTDFTTLLIPDFDLSARNTLALRARSRFGLLIDNAALLPALFDHAARENLPIRILGGGSNVVLAEYFDGITAILSQFGHRVIEETAEHVLIEADAGEPWHNFVAWSVDQGFGGLENLALIPGTAGAAPVQNIGAYGAELADFFHSLTAYDRTTGDTLTFDRAACAFAYRDSLFKREPNRYVVLAIRLALPRRWQPNLRFAGLTDLSDAADLSPRLVMDRVIALRTSKLPDWRVHPNAGSFFQNPIVSLDAAAPVLDEFTQAPNYPQAEGLTKLSAGWLIEKSGLKGFRMGPVGMSERHALVVVNHGGATQADVAALAAHVKRTVHHRFGVNLHEEPIFL
ncbi:UDP-N-acetylmuramate dehydrogenase [Devosia sp. XJ19-1]|uniref:UDP-N-acetylenolpyruvoylglucosamine reductase n=1 Tax=Devosia ureilytica TaxID=2952754 RepID=A0A9Q4ALJ9_9HYPH|nr:UDP-N-acetylmuramate dehydrogenase [Devosia ureilytica]MCP8882193.1 UDP-N-acetylmuramate dehydrogenase [Devosia ureilytica]MCP8885920.1 UDP-N-acetylmuramate dehydrogenase [Devosia ureilytica]